MSIGLRIRERSERIAEQNREFGANAAHGRDLALLQMSGIPPASERGKLMEFEAVLRRVRSEFVEMPGLRLTPAQATILWGLDRDACRQVIDALIDSAFLRWTASGAVTRAGA